MLKSDKYLRNLAAGLVLGLCAVTLSVEANELNKLDIKRSNTSGSSLNVTIFTTSPYSDNIAVSQKSDNKYVILIPNVSGNNASNVDLSSIKDIVSDVNVKSVNDGTNGYTKVTLTTSKPVSITTSTKNSVPLTEEQKAYKNLIAQSRGYVSKNTNSQSQTKSVVEPVKAATQTVTSSTQVIPAATLTPEVKTNKKAAQEEFQPKQKSVIDKLRGKADITAENSEKNKVVESVPAVSKSVISVDEKVSTNSVSDIKVDKTIKESNLSESQSVATISDNVSDNINDFNKRTTRKGFDTSMLTILFTLLTTAFGLIMLAKAIRNQLEHSMALKHSFKEHLHEEPKSKIVDCGDIMENKSLSWQEKYQTFINRMEEISPDSGLIRAVSHGEYEFVNTDENKINSIDNIFKIGKTSDAEEFHNVNRSNLKPEQKLKFTSYNAPSINSEPKTKPIKNIKNQGLKASDYSKLEIVEDKSNSDKSDFSDLISKLDRTLKDSPSVERLNNNTSENVIENQFKTNINKDINSTVVHKEEDVISNTIRTAPKLKAFAQKVALEKSDRKISLPKNSSEIIKSRNIESKHVNLENSTLYSSARKFKDANLNSSALIANSSYASKKNISKKTEQTKSGEYSLATVEDYLNSSSDSNYEAAPKSLSNRVAESLGRMGKEDYSEYSPAKRAINSTQNKIVKSGYKIDDNSGFYIISDESGKSSLVGRVKNSETILKEFDLPVTDRLQVRKDSDNIYMVRVGSERFLVELNGEKMGVLIEL